MKLDITEMFLIKADWGRTFIGTLTRDNAKDGSDIVRGKVMVNDGNLLGVAKDDNELMKNLDEICVMKLDIGIHDFPGESTIISEIPFFLN